ncbi:unnamed protein product [Cylicocyclus nassatus]|uniref:Uncharacterized protein n=1 Tax=Cylicocyclus nassatus TaxID=53992 RepID=A0AA36DKC3_CYLNA|nr:unnamed protein product [Cylicocyclus nassatus]
MFCIDPCLLVPLQLLFYAFYRLIRVIILAESDLFTLIRKLSQPEQIGNVEFFSIITRYRLEDTDIAQEYDFLIFNDGFGNLNDLKDNNWMIYTITDRYVYFVRIPASTALSISNAPRLTSALHSYSDRAARMDINIFTHEVRSSISPSKGRVVMLHSSPCCGGSMLARLLDSVDQSQELLLVHSEPPFLSALAVLVNIVSIETIRSVTNAALRFTMQHLQSDQILVMKTRSCCAKIVPYVHASTPSIQHLFVTSRDPTLGIPRLISATSAKMPVFEIACNLLSYSSILCDFFTSWRLLEPEMVRKIGPTTPFEFALAQIMGCVISYQRTLKYYALETIYAEDLMNDPDAVMRPILDVCGYSHYTLNGCKGCISEEQKRIEFTPTTSLSETQRIRVKLLVDYLQQDWCR